MKKSKPTCGCERRGSRVFECAYHTGVHDGEDLTVAAIVAWLRDSPNGDDHDRADCIERGEHLKGGK